MKNSFLILSFLFFVSSFGQVPVGYTLIDKKINLIPEKDTYSTKDIANYIATNFISEEDKIRAIFYWTASNISYDVANMLVVNLEETPKDRISKTLKTRKGICGDYALIFNEIATQIGINSVVISGYTKQNGKIDSLSHAWCAAKIDSKWFVFDPTFGAGFVSNGKFVKKINNSYFKVEPSKIISSHIPFDYLWQFLNYPVTNGEFYESKTQINKTKKYFDFEKEIAKQTNLSEIDQLFESTERIEKNGLKNKLIVDYYENRKKNLIALRQNNNIEKLNSISSEMNEAVLYLNDFILYRNKKFKPTLADEEIINMIQKPREKLIKCQNEIQNIGSIGVQNVSNLSSMKKSIESNLAIAEEHFQFVKTYMTKSKLTRKTMFSKVSWFGIPLN